jgi:dynein heavy chain
MYEGRTEMPDSLISLFRPITMMVPDSDLIAEIILLSDGIFYIVRLYKSKNFE